MGVEPERLNSPVDCSERNAASWFYMLDAADKLSDLRVPPGNHLEALKGDRKGQYRIRINDQFRLCFAWRDNGAEEAEIVDYHHGN